MKKWFSLSALLLLLSCLTACGTQPETPVDSGLSQPEFDSTATEPVQDAVDSGLELSGLSVRITCGDQSAVFQLYDTEAARGLYEQLPLELEAENFGQAQWMFYPPEKLAVTDEEAYHDGKKGELSYYAPWGDVFILYEDFHSGDEMHRLGICTEGLDCLAEMSGTLLIEREDAQTAGSMRVTIGDSAFTASLADNSSAQALAELLREGPLTIDMRDYGNMEKVGPIGQSLPKNDEQITTGPGDIILYLGNSLVIYYDTNFWDFTRIGKIDDVTQEELLAAMGTGNVTVTFELME